MTQPSHTNYMRSVNDYSLSAHEIYNTITGNRFPTDTRVYTATNITSEVYTEAVKIVIEPFLNDGYHIDSNYSINYEDGAEPEEKSQHTIYEQKFYVLKNDNIIGSNPIVLEMYRRNNELVILTLSDVSTLKYIEEAGQQLRSQFKAKKKDKVFYTISQSSHGFELEEMKIPTVYDETQIANNYNDDFKAIHNTITDHIDNDKKGLILLHGIPGSGKTSYIKQLISKGGLRKLVYIPPHLASSIASPSFISFVRDQMKNCVLIIEDAEEILKDRAGVGDSTAVSNLLNVSDGILGDSLNILIISTFNIEKSFIDPALMRKGRMVCEYYFGELSWDKAQSLTELIHGEGAELTIEKGELCTLANIFNMDFVQHRSKGPTKVAQFGFASSK